MKTTTRARWRNTLATTTLALLAACGGGGGTEPTGTPGAGNTPEFVAVGSSAHTVSLGWKAVAGANGYTVERKRAGEAFAPVATLASDTDQYLDEGLETSTAYTYRLAANGVAGAVAEQAATTAAAAAVVTPVGARVGMPAGQSIGSAGGQIVSADGAARLTVPADALAADANASLQAITNTAPDGQGNGVHVHVDGAPVKPLTLTLAYASALAPMADGLGVAMQRSDGSWLSLPVMGIDKTNRTLSVELPADTRTLVAAGSHAEAAAAGGVSLDVDVVTYLDFWLAPREATVEVGKTLLLVPYAHTLVAIGTSCVPDETGSCLKMPILDTREVPFENQKPGYTRKWYVWAEEGGNAAFGTITPRSGAAGATFKAPAHVPAQNPVPVTFTTTHVKSGRSITLTSTITIKEPVWTGIIHGTLSAPGGDIGFSFSAEAVWTPVDGSDGTLFHASGTQSVTVLNYTCTATATPGSTTLPPGALTLDRSVDPPRYTLDVGSLWQTVIAGSCPGNGSTSVGMTVPGRLQVSGTVGGNGDTINGTASQNGIEWDWALTSQL